MKTLNTLKNFGTISPLLLLLSFTSTLLAQAPAAQKQILVDVVHGQRFWNDPAAMAGKEKALVDRINYMHSELIKNASALDAEVSFLKDKITPAALAKTNVLFIHIPSTKYETAEVEAIKQYIQKGGSLFLVMDANYWSTLEQTNVNDIVRPFGITFGEDSPVTGSGGHTKAGVLTTQALPISYHGARLVQGGTPFCFSNEGDQFPFGTFLKVKNGGKIIAMGDGMTALYMTSWEGVENYQCSEFMQDAFTWLMKK